MSKGNTVIYVIDDDASVCKALGRLLRSADLDVEMFSSVEEFLHTPKQEQGSCIIIDIRMPGLTGFDLLQRLAWQNNSIPVIAISAHDDAETREHARELGAVGFYRKPIDDQALLDAIFWALPKLKKRAEHDVESNGIGIEN
jgi:FixJ family two-component response regulator